MLPDINSVPLFPPSVTLTHEEKQSFLRLDKIPVQEVEARAKSRGLWHPRSEGVIPVPGNLVTFDLGNDCAPQLGVVTAVNDDGTLNIRSEAPLRDKQGSPQDNQSDNAIDQQFTVVNGNGATCWLEITTIFRKWGQSPCDGMAVVRDSPHFRIKGGEPWNQFRFML